MSRSNGHDEWEITLQKTAAKQDQVVLPAVRDDLPRLEETIQQLAERLDAQAQRIDDLEARLEAIVGVPGPDASNHEKRVRDARQILLRRAEARGGKASMYWRELADALAGHGHGDLVPQQVHRVFEDVAQSDGFSLATGKRDVAQTDDRSDVREVQVVECDLDAVPGIDPANNVVSGEGHQPTAHTVGQDGHTTNVTQD
ncbi:hypothetical protein AArcSl_1691 [Halalkaliarchaeum desulfuricum]|uniref:Uncharacterized protein n=1 Tax=Halalkaliarchaeum desulfuricum TaxID=2055893 RepID=A0A343TJP8_9EURY|nr:hypothetical protein [Halalkaliarchaeum desulfuricum]AUX09320.1 hypothetical protein AArcSl_1691 [Halalkaliarchaeum desulfuricum]